MMEQKSCQSCGIPLDKAEAISTNAGQSKNKDYCIYCYKDGAFTQDATMDKDEVEYGCKIKKVID